MKIFRATILIILLTIGFIIPTYAETVEQELKPATVDEAVALELTLQDVIDRALSGNQGIVLKNLELEKSKILYDYNIDAVEAAEKALDIKIPVPRTYEVTPDQNVNNNLIRNGASERSVELAYSIAKWNLMLEENKIRYNATKAYYDLINIENELKIAKENLELVQKQYNNGKLRYEVGLISKQQLLGLELALSQAKSVYENTNMYYQLQLMNFNNTIGLPLDEKIVFVYSIEKAQMDPIEIDSLINEAFENNLRVKIAEESYEISKLTLEAKNIKGMGIYYRYKEQEVIVKENEINLNAIRNSVDMGARSAYLNLVTAEKQIATFELAVKQAEEALRIAQLSFDLGQNTPAEIAQANINLMNAKKSLAQQIHAFNLALLDFEYSTGIGK